MRKRLLTAFIIFMFCAAFAASLDFGEAYWNEMSYSLIISEDTTWTKVDSPINLPGNILVSKGATLTIESGVTVNCNKNVIQVNGTLKVQGSAQDKVVFTNTNTIINNAREQLANINFGDESFGNVIHYAIFHTMAWTYYNCKNSILIDHVIIQDGATPTSSGFVSVLPTIRGSGVATITNSVFTSGFQLGISSIVINNAFSDAGISAYDAQFFVITNNTITGTFSPVQGYGIGIEGFQKAVIADNYISNYLEACISINGPAVILRNYVESPPNREGYPSFGIRVEGSSPIIENNTITNAGIGIGLIDQGYILTRPTIRNNNIYNNVNFNLYLGYPARPGYNPKDYTVMSNIDAANNYWGSTGQEINQTIYDSKYQKDIGSVNIAPVLSTPNPIAKPKPNQPPPTIDQVPLATYYQATKDNSQKIILTKIGNLTIYGSDRINVTTSLLPAQTYVTFLMRGDTGHNDFVNITIPKSAIPYGTTPKVFFTNMVAEDQSSKLADNQGYVQDADNYYIWFTTHFDQYYFGTGTIVFADAHAIQTIINSILAIITATAAALIILVLWRRKSKRKNLPQKVSNP